MFEDQVFSKAKKMDVSLLNETVRALDEHSDEEAAPHQNRVWLQVSSKVLEQQKPVVLGLTRHAVAILIIILTILLAGVAIGVIDWTAVFQSAYHDTERQETNVENWSLYQKKDIVAALVKRIISIITSIAIACCVRPNATGCCFSTLDETCSQTMFW